MQWQYSCYHCMIQYRYHNRMYKRTGCIMHHVSYIMYHIVEKGYHKTHRIIAIIRWQMATHSQSEDAISDSEMMQFNAYTPSHVRYSPNGYPQIRAPVYSTVTVTVNFRENASSDGQVRSDHKTNLNSHRPNTFRSSHCCSYTLPSPRDNRTYNRACTHHSEP